MALFGKTKTETVELQVGGMTCGSCVAHVKEALEGVVGVQKAFVDLENGTVRITAAAGTLREALVAAVREAGYAAE